MNARDARERANTAESAVGQTELDARMDLVFKALAAKSRRQIVALLARGDDDEGGCCTGEGVCACVFAEKLGIGAPTVSHHMKTLIEAGIVTAEKRGSWVYYRLRPDTVELLARELLSLSCGCEPQVG